MKRRDYENEKEIKRRDCGMEKSCNCETMEWRYYGVVRLIKGDIMEWRNYDYEKGIF